MRDIFNWLKRLCPRTLWTQYQHDGHRYICIWRMWMGRCWNVMHVRVEGDKKV